MAINIDIMRIRSIEHLDPEERVLEAALIYAKSGAKVMPLFPNTKMPALASWGDASRDPDKIREWFGRGGKFRGGNIALLIDGYKVIDIDRHGDVDGFETLGGALDKAVCPRAVTPNRGEHLLVSKTDVKPGPGVEILSDGNLFTVYPSVIDGKRYMWRTGGVPSPVTRIRVVDDAPTPATATPVAPAGYVRSLLEHLDPDCEYPEWLKVGMAIHHNDAGQTGLELWDEWSAGSKKYKPGECERRWATFDQSRSKPVALRWLIVEAVKCGKKITREDLLYHGNLYNSIEIERINEKYGLFDMGGKMYVVYREGDTIHFASPPDFRLKIADQKIEADGKLKPLADVWLEHPDRRIITAVDMWMPGTEPEGALNMFEGFAVQPVECEESEIQFFLDFCLDVICRGNKAHFTFLMDMLAKKLQRPMATMKLALVLRGGEGIGKGALTRVMENIIGPKHATNVSSPRSWLGDYAGALLKSTIWLTANEAYWSGNPQQSERLKALVTEEWLDMEEKFVNARKQRNRLMIAITSNNLWAVPAGHDSRRYFVLDVSPHMAKNVAFWEEFHALMGADEETGKLNNPEYLGKVLYWFQQRKITSNLRWALETNWLQDQRRESAIESREDAFIMWVRSSFVTSDRSSDVITAAGGGSFAIMNRPDGVEVVRADKLFEDYRTYISKVSRKPRMAMTYGGFAENMEKLGFDGKRVVKDRLTMGGHKLPDATGAGSKIAVMRLPSAYEIEDRINAEFPMFGHNIEEDEE